MVVTKEMYLELKEQLEEVGVIVKYSSCEIDGDKREYDIYFINNHKQVLDASGSEHQKGLLEQFNIGL